MNTPIAYTQRGSGTPLPWRVLRRRNQYGTSSALVVGRGNAPVCEPKHDADAEMLAAGPSLLTHLLLLRQRSAQMAQRFAQHDDAYHRNMVEAAISESDELVRSLT